MTVSSAIGRVRLDAASSPNHPRSTPASGLADPNRARDTAIRPSGRATTKTTSATIDATTLPTSIEPRFNLPPSSRSPSNRCRPHDQSATSTAAGKAGSRCPLRSNGAGPGDGDTAVGDLDSDCDAITIDIDRRDRAIDVVTREECIGRGCRPPVAPPARRWRPRRHCCAGRRSMPTAPRTAPLGTRSTAPPIGSTRPDPRHGPARPSRGT